MTGATHYELRRSLVGYWVKYPNTRVNGGMATAAADLASCKEICATSHSCIWIDWSLTATVGFRCYVHDYRSIYEIQAPAQGVSHYRLHRGNDGYCGNSNVYIHSVVFH